jgi:signal transduction histidine kinase
VVINLLSNARDATEAHRDEEGAARRPGVLIRTGSNGVDNDSRVQIQIIDSGVGIPADIVPKVFDPFFTTKGPKKGTGLGLLSPCQSSSSLVVTCRSNRCQGQARR